MSDICKKKVHKYKIYSLGNAQAYHNQAFILN